MRHLIILALLLLPIATKADQPRSCHVFASPNGKYELRYLSGQFSQQRWSLVEKANGRVHYQVLGDFSSQTVLVSDDAINLVVVDDYCDRAAGPNLDVLQFYRDGSQVKKYSLGDLLKDVSNIQRSVSHFQWFFNASSLSINESRLRLETFELTNYEFDTRTGNLLTRERNPYLSEDSVYVYGKVKKLGRGLFEIDVCQQVFGVVPEGGKISFVSDRDDIFYRDNSYHSVIIKNGTLVALPDVILNSCTYPRSSRP